MLDNPNLRRLYFNNSRTLKRLYTILEHHTIYGASDDNYIDLAEVVQKIDSLIDLQLSIRDEAFKKSYKAAFIKLTSPITNRTKKDYLTPAFFCLNSKV